MQILQDCHFVLQRRLLLGGEPHLIDDFNCHGTTRYPVDPAVDDTELARAKHLVREDLVGLADLRLSALLLLLAGLPRPPRPPLTAAPTATTRPCLLLPAFKDFPSL